MSTAYAGILKQYVAFHYCLGLRNETKKMSFSMTSLAQLCAIDIIENDFYLVLFMCFFFLPKCVRFKYFTFHIDKKIMALLAARKTQKRYEIVTNSDLVCDLLYSKEKKDIYPSLGVSVSLQVRVVPKQTRSCFLL